MTALLSSRSRAGSGSRVKPVLLRAAATLLFVSLVPTAAHAGTVFSDTFESGTSPWTPVNGNVTLSNPADATIGTGKALGVSSTTTFMRADRSFATVSIPNTNDSITLSFDVNITGTVTNSSAGFRMGLGGDSGTYALLLPTGTTTGRTLVLYPKGAIGGSTSTTLLGQGGVSGLTDQAAHHIDMTITRNSSGGTDLSASLDHGAAITYTDTNASVTDFNALLIGEGSNNESFALDNVTVSTAPEPAAIGLCALAGLGLLARRRRA